jgi:hypothetical protein
MDLYENYFKQARKYLVEDEDEELEDIEDVADEEVPADEDVPAEGEEGGEEALELDLSNPVCPACGAELAPVDEPIDTEDEDLGLEDDEAAAIDLLQGLGYVVYKPEEDAENGEPVDDDFAGENGEDFNEDDFAEDEEIQEED